MRHFVNVSWNNSAENYDGYQQMNKHFNPNGTAAVHQYSDEALEEQKKPKVDMSIPLEIRQLDKLDSDILTNERMYRSRQRSEEMYKGIKKILDAKHEKLVKKLDRMGFFNDNETQEEESSWQWIEKPSLPYVFDSKINEKMFRVYVYTLKQTFKIIRNFVRGY